MTDLGFERVELLVNWLVANWAVSAGDKPSVDMCVVSWADLLRLFVNWLVANWAVNSG